MNARTSLPTAILHFAFSGLFGPHRTDRIEDYEAPRVVSTSERVFIKRLG